MTKTRETEADEEAKRTAAIEAENRRIEREIAIRQARQKVTSIRTALTRLQGESQTIRDNIESAEITILRARLELTKSEEKERIQLKGLAEAEAVLQTLEKAPATAPVEAKPQN